MKVSSPAFPDLVDAALVNDTLRESLTNVRYVMPDVRRRALEDEEFAALSVRARDVRDAALDDLDAHLDAFEAKVVALGGQVHRADDGEHACRIVADICKAAGVREIAKSKSMVTEEIELNAHLERAGYRVTETDLGEYIIQLRGETPSHILAPALHVGLDEVGRTFEASHPRERQGPLEDPQEMLLEAREVLRERFLGADAGITGANFLIAETGGVVIVTNEGNADLTATLPDTHIVVTGIEKVVPKLADVGVLLRVLARSAIGERLSNYTSFVHGPRRGDETSGPRNYHVVLLDNGRRRMLRGPFRDMLRCIRCSACLNHCPVYTAVGGHAYGSVYSGPMGAVLTPALASLASARHLPNASTLCGRCAEVCPVQIPLPDLLRRWREREHDARRSPLHQRGALRAWQWASRWPGLHSRLLGIAARLLRAFAADGWIRRLPGPGAAWFASRDLRVPPRRSFQTQWHRARR